MCHSSKISDKQTTEGGEGANFASFHKIYTNTETCQSQKTMNIPQRKHQNSAPLLQPVRIQPSKRFIFATHALLQIPIMRIVRMIVVCLSASVMLVQNVAMKHWVMMWSILGWDLRIATVLLWRREAA